MADLKAQFEKAAIDVKGLTERPDNDTMLRLYALSDEIKDAHPGVAWASTIRMRNRIVHGYWSIDLDVLLATAADDLPDFAVDVRAVLTQVSSEDEKH